MRDFILVRHGEAKAGPSKMDRDFFLTDLGRRQAQALGERLKAGGAAPERIYSSRLTRARQTAAILAEHLRAPVEERDDLIEHGSEVFLLDGSIEEAARLHPDKVGADGQVKTVQGEISGLHWGFTIGGENMAALHRRARGVWESLVAAHPEPAGQCLIVSHGSFLSAMLTEALGLPLRSRWNFHLANASCVCLRVYRDGPNVAQASLCASGPFGVWP